MLPDTSHTKDDLEYLSGMGYAMDPDAAKDVDMLRHKVRTRTRSSSFSWKLITVSALAGALAGIGLFYLLSVTNKPVLKPMIAAIAKEEASEKNDSALFAQLDPVDVKTHSHAQKHFKNESFSKPAHTEPVSLQPDSIYALNSRLPDVELSPEPSAQIPNLKYIANAPVLFIHDLKVTNYHHLYFKKEHVIDLEDAIHKSVDASQESKDSKTNDAFMTMGRRHYYLHQALSDALYYFSTGKYAEARTLFYRIKSYTKQDINCDFYLGMCYYYEQNPAKALKYFNLVLDNPNNTFLQEAEFYKALSLDSTGDKDNSISLLKKIKADGGFYSAKASAYLKP